MKSRILYWVALTLAALVLASCVQQPAQEEINYRPEQFTGLWYKVNNPYEYWRFNSDMTGVTWDETPDPETGEPEITEEESNLKYTWSINRNVLMFAWTGDMGNQNVPRYYYIKSVSPQVIDAQDDYGLSFTLMKKAE